MGLGIGLARLFILVSGALARCRRAAARSRCRASARPSPASIALLLGARVDRRRAARADALSLGGRGSQRADPTGPGGGEPLDEPLDAALPPRRDEVFVDPTSGAPDAGLPGRQRPANGGTAPILSERRAGRSDRDLRGIRRPVGPCYPRRPGYRRADARSRSVSRPMAAVRRSSAADGTARPAVAARDRAGAARTEVGAPRTSTASCPGWSSTRASCSRPATSAIRCSSGSSSWRSSRATSTSSSRSASPACASRSRPARPPARPTAGRPRSSSTPPAPRVLELVARALGDLPRRPALAGRRRRRDRRLRRDPGAPRRAPPALPRRDLPGPDAARRRPRAPVPVHLDAQPVDRGRACATRRPASAASPGSRCRRSCRACSRSRSRVRAHRPGHRGQPRRPVLRAWRSSSTTSSGSPATPTSRSRRTRPTTCCSPSRRSFGAGASARPSASRSSGRCRPRPARCCMRGLGLEEDDCYEISGMLDLTGLWRDRGPGPAGPQVAGLDARHAAPPRPAR